MNIKIMQRTKSLSLTFIALFFLSNIFFSVVKAETLNISSLIPDGLGVNIHSMDLEPSEIKILTDANLRWVRQDIFWELTEKSIGKYDFTVYDRLLNNLRKHNIRAILILGYANPLYDQGLSPYTDLGRKAFSDWAVAAVKHFKGRGILWEMYNEPNEHFWTPKPNVNDYIKLALKVGKAIHEAGSQEAFIGPATSKISLPFLEACFKSGLLNYWSAVSVHPYRGTNPESASIEFKQLRLLINSYTHVNKKIPIISGEWGYPSIPEWGYPSIPYRPSNLNEQIQGKYLARQWLNNLANGIVLSIWYDLVEDGVDPKNPEHHFGIVRNTSPGGKTKIFEPKPAYTSAKTLIYFFRGFQFHKRLSAGKADDYILNFRNPKTGEVRLAVWSNSPLPHKTTIPIYSGRFRIVTHMGQMSKKSSLLKATSKGLTITLTDAPQYLIST
jgi:polysaccharide biosynthesis protein PslG